MLYILIPFTVALSSTAAFSIHFSETRPGQVFDCLLCRHHWSFDYSHVIQSKKLDCNLQASLVCIYSSSLTYCEHCGRRHEGIYCMCCEENPRTALPLPPKWIPNIGMHVPRLLLLCQCCEKTWACHCLDLFFSSLIPLKHEVLTMWINVKHALCAVANGTSLYIAIWSSQCENVSTTK